MKPIGSAITTLREVQHSKTGTPGGGRGLATPESMREIATWLSKQVPAEMDKAAVSRALSRGVKLSVRLEGRYPTGPNGERMPSYTVAAGCDIHGDAASREVAKADLQNFMVPPDVRKIEHWLAELSVLTAGRGREGIDAELMVNAYASRLGAYPADVVRFAILSKTWKWFPSWGELERVCEAKAGPRRHMLASMSKPVPDPEPVRRAPTKAERQRIQDLVNEMFPAISQEWREAAVAEALKGNCMGDHVEKRVAQ